MTQKSTPQRTLADGRYEMFKRLGVEATLQRPTDHGLSGQNLEEFVELFGRTIPLRPPTTATDFCELGRFETPSLDGWEIRSFLGKPSIVSLVKSIGRNGGTAVRRVK